MSAESRLKDTSVSHKMMERAHYAVAAAIDAEWCLSDEERMIGVKDALTAICRSMRVPIEVLRRDIKVHFALSRIEAIDARVGGALRWKELPIRVSEVLWMDKLPKSEVILIVQFLRSAIELAELGTLAPKNQLSITRLASHVLRRMDVTSPNSCEWLLSDVTATMDACNLSTETIDSSPVSRRALLAFAGSKDLVRYTYPECRGPEDEE